MTQAVEAIEDWIKQGHQRYVCVTPAHAVMECYLQPELRPIFNNSGLTTPDGMAIVWLLRLTGRNQVNRVYGPDLMLSVCERSIDRGYKHFFYGGVPGVANELTARLQTRFPGLRVAGTYSPPFHSLSSREDEALVERINRTLPDIVWIGISTPKQERWMSEHVGKLSAPVLIGVGAAFDFLSGRKKQAPRWIQRSGMEWLFRLASEPRRLWRRYSNYPLFVLLALAQALKLKRFPLE
jgi:N-acetylglucosaminyldiphosphoundecaprenol N-acetyl-beta-D-mannosaminyltransferase